MSENCLLRGTVVSVSIMTKGKYSFLVKADSILPDRGHSAFFGKNIICFTAQEPPLRGYVEMRGAFRTPQRREAPGIGFDEFSYYMSNGLWGTFYGNSLVVKEQRRSFFDSWAEVGRSLVKQSLMHIHNKEYRGVLIASFLNDRGELSETMKSLFYRAGIYHLLALSGFNIAILAGVVYAILLLFPIRKEWKIIVALTVVWLYLFFIGFIPSLFRAVIMTTVVGVSFLFQKKSYGLNSLGIAGIAWLIMSPSSLFTPGFQLSFSATFGLIALSPLLLEYIQLPFSSGLIRTVLRFLIGTAAVSIASFIATIPILIYHFHQIYLFGLVANLFAVSLMAISMWLACIGFIFQLISTPLAAVCMCGAELFLEVMTQGAGLVRFVPWSMIRFSMPYSEIYIVFTIFILGVILVKQKLRSRYCAIALPACAVLSLLCIRFHMSHQETYISWLPMKSSCLIAVKWPNNRAWLFDIGTDMPKPQAYSQAILPWLSQFMDCRIEKVILPRWKHNSAHFLVPLLENEKTAQIVYCDSAFGKDDDFLSFVHSYKRSMTNIKPGESMLASNKCTCTVISRRDDISPQSGLAFVLRINRSTVFLPDLKEIKPDGRSNSFKTLVIGKRGNFNEL
jgi:ComEC/Rec2-related protein